jgi:hypothetical protein
MHFVQLLQMREVGLPIPDEALIEAATIQDKKKLIEMMQQIKQQAAQSQEAQQQVQMQEIQARTDLARSRAIADQGLGLERMSRIEENKAMAVERMHEAQKDDDIALLNLIKALKEIDSMDIEHIERLVGVAHSIQERSEAAGAVNEEKQSAESSRKSVSQGGA